jgi:hypothetical protein
MAGKRLNPLRNFFGTDNIETLETTFSELGKVGKGVKDGLVDDLGKKSTQTFIEQLLGDIEPTSQKKSGDLKPGEEITFGKKKKDISPAETKRKPQIEAGIDYRREILHGGEQIRNRDNQEISQQIKEIMNELQRLVQSSAVLQAEFIDIGVSQKPQNVGKYHQNFFEWMLIVIRSARQKVEDSGAWLNTMKGKKKQRQYGSMAKKHGTTFTLSNERTVATQSG